MRLANPASIPRAEKVLGRANCLAGDVVGDCVIITGAKVSNRFQVRRIDPGVDTAVAVGILIEKTSATEGTVQFLGPMAGVYVGLLPGATYYVGDDGRLTTTATDQVMGIAVDNDAVVISPSLVLPGGGGGGGGSGWIYVTDITDSGGPVSKTYQDTGNKVLATAEVPSGVLTVDVRASFPMVNVGGVNAELTRAADQGHFSGTVAVTVVSSTTLQAKVKTPDGADGAVDNVSITLDLPPTITVLAFTGSYPGAQTELKAGDTFQIQVTADGTFDRVEILDHEACSGAIITVPSGLTATVTATIANRGNTAVSRYARVRVRDSVTLAYGPTRDTNTGGGTTDGVNLVVLNNLHPSGSITSIVYPATQSAIKATESATVNHTATNYDTIAYTDPTNAQVFIPFPGTFAAAKVVDAAESLAAIFNNSTTNFRYTMVRNANAATTVVNGVVVIANVAPTITVTEPASRLRSGGNNGTAVQSHTITLTSSQPLAAAPTLNADSGGSRGTFSGAWAGGPSVWTRAISVSEVIPDERGTFSWLGLVATGLAGLVQNTINGNATYVLGGFVSRTLTVTPFANGADINTSVVDFSKLTAVDIPALGLAMVKQPIGTAVQLDTPANESKRGWYTIDATGINPTRLILLHQGTIDGNAAGMTITGVQETV